MRYKRWLSKVRKNQGNLTNTVAYQIIVEQFFFTDAKEIDITLIDKCLDCLFPDRHEWTYPGKKRGWDRLLKRLESEESTQETRFKKVTPSKHHRRISPIVALLVLLLVFLSGTVAYAFGFNFMEYVVRWTEEILNITVTVDYPETGIDTQEVQDNTSHGIARDLEDALNELGMHPHLPQWKPDGFRLVETSQYSIEPDITAIDAYYLNDSGQEFYISIYDMKDNVTFNNEIEKSSYYREYKHNDRIYYIVKNLEMSTATWFDLNYWITIDGSLSEYQLQQMIDSIYE